MKKRIMLLGMSLLLSLSIVGCDNSNNTNNVNVNIDNTNSSVTTTISTQTTDSNIQSNENNDNPWENADLSPYLTQLHENITPITPFDVYSKINNKETFILYIGKTNCKWCQVVYPSLDLTTKQNIPIFYVNTQFFGDFYPDEESPDYDKYYNIVKQEHIKFQDTLMYSGVPCFRFIENGEVVYGMSNPLPNSYYAETATEESRVQDVYKMIDVVNEFFIDCENIENIDTTKIDNWEAIKNGYSITQQNREKEEEEINTTPATITSEQITIQDVWKLEKQYGVRLVPSGETSYWDMVE